MAPVDGAVMVARARFHSACSRAASAARTDGLSVPVGPSVASARRRSASAASTEAIARLLPAAAGRAMQAELEALAGALDAPERPLAALIGGAKVSTKIAVLENLTRRVDAMVIGGAMAKLPHQSGLADSGLAAHVHRLTTAGCGAGLQSTLELTQLGQSADEGTPARRHLLRSDQTPRVDLLGETLHVERNPMVEGETLRQQAPHSVRDQDVDAALIDEIKRRNVGYTPTLTRDLARFVYEGIPDFLSDPFFLQRAEPYAAEIEVVRDPARQEEMRTSEVRQADKVGLQRGERNLKTLSDAGVLIGLGTDTGTNVGQWQGYFEHVELEMMVEVGMTPMQVLVAATGGAARAAGLDDDLGTLQPGLAADLLVLDANPLDDIRAMRQIDSVWIAGQQLSYAP